MRFAYQFGLSCAIVGSVALLASQSAHATPVLEFSGGQKAPVASDATQGWYFTTNRSITVDALDAFDPSGSDGTVGAVRLYDGLGNVLASATVTAGDPIEGSPIPFYSEAINPVTLAANTTYYIAEDMSFTTQLYYSVTGLITDASITYDGAVEARGQGQDPVTDLNGQIYDPSYFGPNFDIRVPEPSTLYLFIAGLASVIRMGRRRKKARAT